jgi:hypothetical protein
VWCVADNAFKRLYDRYVVNKPKFFRFDSGVFTETGAGWTDSFDQWNSPGVADWSKSGQTEANRSRFSNALNCSISFDWDLSEFEKMQFVYDLDYRTLSLITIAVTPGEIEVFNGIDWVEANGYQFSQNIDPLIAVESSGYGLFVNKVRLDFRRVSEVGTMTLTMTKNANSDPFYYWGAAFWNGKTVHFHNLGRPGQKSRKLVNFNKDIVRYNPDLIVCVAPLINEIIGGARFEKIANDVEWWLFGDRIGNINDLAVSKVSDGVDMVVVLPHIQAEGFSGNDSIDLFSVEMNWEGLLNEIKARFYDRDSVYYIDLMTEMFRVAALNGWTLEQAFANSGNDAVPTSFVLDGKHTNRYGSDFWACVLDSNLRPSDPVISSEYKHQELTENNEVMINMHRKKHSTFSLDLSIAAIEFKIPALSVLPGQGCLIWVSLQADGIDSVITINQDNYQSTVTGSDVANQVSVKGDSGAVFELSAINTGSFLSWEIRQIS